MTGHKKKPRFITGAFSLEKQNRNQNTARYLSIDSTPIDLPPLKWSSLKYIFRMEDEIDGKEEAYG